MISALAACAADMKTADYAYRNQDYNSARKHYEKLADKGFPEAQTSLGRIYLYGKGIERDPEKALELFRQASRPGGDPRAKRYIPRALAYAGRSAVKGEAKYLTPRQGLQMLRQAAAENNKTALFELGYAWENGLAGLQPDGRKATEYYLKAAGTGYGRAYHYLADMYEDGELVPRNLDIAVRLYENAVRNDYPRAAVNLGRLYEKGEGVAQNKSKAMAYYRYAQNNGVPAKEEIARLMSKDFPDKTTSNENTE